ncbi:MAG: ATP-binding protein [Myxococcaceae bacterium]
MFQRLLSPPKTSAFLLGPRGTGKSTWIAQAYPDAVRYDLLDTREALRLAREPGLLFAELGALRAGTWVIVDEIQKVPSLLDEVHRLMEEKKLRFLLSGSSARKLRKGGANLLAGRALNLEFFPLVSREMGRVPSLSELPSGMLPMAVTSDDAPAYLDAYCQTYLKEEIQAEALTRSIGSFARFLEVAARQNGMVTNTSNIARDAQVARQTVQGYFDILVDTLLGYWLPAYKLKRATKVVAHPKFYFFDAGVARGLGARAAYPPTGEELGVLCETYLLHEIRAYLSYAKLRYPMHYFRTHNDVETDLLVETRKGFVAVEFKAATQWRNAWNRGFARLREEMPGKKLRCLGVYTGSRAAKSDDVEVVPYALFLKQLWDGSVL